MGNSNRRQAGRKDGAETFYPRSGSFARVPDGVFHHMTKFLDDKVGTEARALHTWHQHTNRHLDSDRVRTGRGIAPLQQRVVACERMAAAPRPRLS